MANSYSQDIRERDQSMNDLYIFARSGVPRIDTLYICA